MRRFISSLLIVTLLSACAGSSYRPLVDRPGDNYEQDLAQCQQYAQGEANAAAGAAVGVVLGVALGLFFGYKTGFQRDFATAGALGGALGGAQGADQNQIDVIRNCLRGRGHNVLR